MLTAMLVGLSMLTKADIGQLQGSRLSPNAQSSVAAMVNTRPTVVARATYGLYGPQSIAFSPVNYTFPTLPIGAQIRMKLYGTVRNSSATTKSQFFISAGGYQDVQSLVYGSNNSITVLSNQTISWMADAVWTVSPSQATDQAFTPSLSSTGFQQTQSIQSGYGPNQSVRLTGNLLISMSDASGTGTGLGGSTVSGVSGGNQIGGVLVTTGDILGPGGSFILNQTIPLNLGMTFIVGATNTWTIQGGWIEVM